MLRDGQAVLVGDFAVPRGRWFDWHQHPEHQLAWAATGVALVRIGERTWVLPPGRALWIPAGVVHTTGASVAMNLRSLYLDPGRCPLNWALPTVIAVPALLRELIVHLGDPALPAPARLRAESVLFDLLAPVPTTALEVPDPKDTRLRPITAALRADPTDERTLAGWGQLVGASARNLARLFVTETGMTFGQWRTQLRLQAALPLLADGMAVGRVAGRVGYATPSAFVAAFRRAVGVPPAAYFGWSSSSAKVDFRAAPQPPDP
ncbi:MAG TPA: helix-turn-helix transcriptional regulator [Pseudonocardiaceae bacterium]|jgi:AraC-like DNA-binding protein|nr:helix-turn-helix transcriptional regulator [Pseudonocardiaceae bacterium]